MPWLTSYAAQVFHNSTAAFGVKARNRLVAQDDARVLNERTGNTHALLLAARKLVGATIGKLAQANLVKQLERTEFLTLAVQAQRSSHSPLVAQATMQHVLNSRETIHQIVVLEDHGRSACARRAACCGADA